MTDCRFVDRHSGALVDGELDPASILSIERHVDICAGCQERVAFERRSRLFVHDALGGVRAPDGLRERICAALDHVQPVRDGVSNVRIVAGYGGLAAVAAAVLLFAGGTFRSDASFASLTGGGESVRPLLEDVVRLHSSALPADVVADAPQRVPSYFRGKVAFPVRPALFDRRDVRLVGARYANVHAHNAVALYYDVGGHRVTVVVYEAPGVSTAGVRLVRHGQREMLYDELHGYAVPVRSDGTLHYAFTGDVDRRTLIELAAAARVSP